VLRDTQSPIAGDDETSTSLETPVVIDVLTNDSDPDGVIDPTTVQIDHDGDPGNGAVAIDLVTGRITYTPNPGFVGTDTFSYFVLDNDLAGSNLATVTVTVLAPPFQEVSVTGNGENIAHGDATPDTANGTDFGRVAQNQLGPIQLFTVRNLGGETLSLGPVSVPPRFTLVEPLVASLAPGESDTFSVRFDTAVLGTFGGLVSFANNDADENPFQFSITGRVRVVPGSLGRRRGDERFRIHDGGYQPGRAT
jgi:hypothetical protein